VSALPCARSPAKNTQTRYFTDQATREFMAAFGFICENAGAIRKSGSVVSTTMAA